MEDLKKEISDADKILIGLGEDFEDRKNNQKVANFIYGKSFLQDNNLNWLLPAWKEFCSTKNEENDLSNSLMKLKSLLEEKDYYIVSLSNDSRINKIFGDKNHLVMPCGSNTLKQCKDGCEQTVNDIDGEERRILNEWFEKLFCDPALVKDAPYLKKCPVCNQEMVLNNILNNCYDENGYLEQWKDYTKWLQSTINRKLLILELGVGLNYPTVIRWPFEKVAFYNNKAKFVRVHETLYQLTEELSEKGKGISKNAIDWLNLL